MEIRPNEYPFYILPFITIVKVKNTLTKEAQITFNYKWDKYYYIEFGWLEWGWRYNV